MSMSIGDALNTIANQLSVGAHQVFQIYTQAQLVMGIFGIAQLLSFILSAYFVGRYAFKRAYTKELIHKIRDRNSSSFGLSKFEEDGTDIKLELIQYIAKNGKGNDQFDKAIIIADEYVGEFPYVIGLIVGIMAGVVMLLIMFSLTDSIGRMIMPQYYAVNDILNKIASGT
jgi:MFS family permease